MRTHCTDVLILRWTCSGNCRKRKIRCLQDKNDAQGRCVTCIRLRKDCVYEPVDHGPSGNPIHTGGSATAQIGQPVSSPSITPDHPTQTHINQHQVLPATVQNLGHRTAATQEGDHGYPASQNSTCRSYKLHFKAASRQISLLKFS